jgi:hypothetical protein
MPKKSLMDNVSRPLIALLVGTVAFFALWMTMLKPSSSSSSGNKAAQYQSAVAKARQAVGTSAAASVAHGGTVATTSAAKPAHPVTSAATTRRAAAPPAAAAHAAATARTTATARAPVKATPDASAAKQRQNVVTRALASHRVLALLFFNPAEADDRAVKQELASVPGHGGKVVKLAVPLTELTRYSVVTSQVQLAQSPTLVLIDGHRQADTITGFADRFEIAQRVDDALALG